MSTCTDEYSLLRAPNLGQDIFGQLGLKHERNSDISLNEPPLLHVQSFVELIRVRLLCGSNIPWRLLLGHTRERRYTCAPGRGSRRNRRRSLHPTPRILWLQSLAGILLLDRLSRILRLNCADAVEGTGHGGTEGTTTDGGTGGMGGDADAVYFGLLVEAWRKGCGYEGELAGHRELYEVHCDAKVRGVERAAGLGI